MMKDLSEALQREKVHVTGINSMIVKGDQHMRFSVEVPGGDAMQQILHGLRQVSGVLAARRM